MFSLKGLFSDKNRIFDVIHKPEELKSHLEQGAEVNFRAKDGRTPLMLTIDAEYLESFPLLLEHGADVNFKDMSNNTALIYALKKGNIEFINILVQNGADVNATNHSSDTPFLLVVEKMEIGLIELFLENGADINTKNFNNDTPLMIAISDENIEIVKLLLQNGADVNSRNEDDDTPLIRASIKRNIKLVKLLLENSADVNAKDEDDVTSLMLVSEKGRIEFVKEFINYGVDVNAKDRFGKTPLMYASMKGQTEVISVLLKGGADINAEDEEGNTAIDLSTKKGTLKVFDRYKELLKISQQSSEEVNAKNKAGNTPLLIASKKGDIELVKTLLQNGADVNAKNKGGDTPFVLALNNQDIELVKILLKNDADIEDHYLHIALQKEDIELATILLQNGADVNAKNKGGDTPFVLALNNKDIESVKILLKNGADIEDHYLHIALQKEDIELTTILLQNGADVNAKNKAGNTPLLIASKEGDIELVKILLQNGADVNTKNKDAISSLIIAAQQGQIEIVKTLLQNGADVNAKENYGRSSLDAVLPYGDIGIVKLLLENGADVNAKNAYGLTVSTLASINNQKDLLELLLKYEEKPLLRKPTHEIVLNKDGETYKLSLKEKQAFEPELPKKHSLGIDLTYVLPNANNFDWPSKKEEVRAIFGVEHIKLFKDSDNNYVVRVFEDSNEAKLVNLLEIDNQQVELFDFKEENHTTYLYFHTKHGVPLSAWKEKQAFIENILKQPVEIELYDESHSLYDPSYHRENLVLIKEHPISVMPDELKLGGTYLKEEEVNKRKSYTFKDVDSREKWEEKLADIEKFLGVHLIIKDYNKASKILSLEESLVESLPKILDIKDAHGVYSKLMHTKIEDGRSTYYYSYLHGVSIKDWKDQLRRISLRTIFNEPDKVYTIDIYDSSSEDYDRDFSQDQLVKVSEFLEIPAKNDLLDVRPDAYLQKDKVFWGYGSGKHRYYTSITDTSHFMAIGGTGSGKSNFMNGLVLSLLHNIESIGKLYLIDLKDGIEFDMYKKLDSTKVEVFSDATKPSLLLAALYEVEAEMYLRTKYVRSKEDIKKVTHDPIFLIIDEYGEIERMGTRTPEERMAKEEIFVVLDRIASQARSSNIKLFVQTQNPRSISNEIKINLKSRALLKTGTVSDRELTIQQADELEAMDINHVKFPLGRYVFEDFNEGDANINELQFPFIDPDAKYHMDYRDEAQQSKNDFELELQPFVDEVRHAYPHLSDTKILGGEKAESPDDSTQAAIAVDEPRQELKKEPSSEKFTEIRLDLDDDLFGFEDEEEEDDIFSEITLLEEENKKLFDEIMQGAN